MTRLRKKQKEALLEWLSEGLKTDEINARAEAFRPPFVVTRRQATHYRKSREDDIKTILQVGEHDALMTGLATREMRVFKLKQLAALMERDLFKGFLWTENIKSVKSGEINMLVDYEEFNKAEVDSYRGVLDDIAKEVGQRVQKVSIDTWETDLVRGLRDGTITPEAVLANFHPTDAVKYFKEAGIEVKVSETTEVE